MSTVNQLGKYQPYPEYKDSGISWLGHIPIEWELRRAKFIFQRIQRVVRDNDNIVTAFRDGQVTLRLNRRTDGFTNALQEIGYQGVRKGDLLIHAMDGFAGAIGISDSDGKCSPVCSVCIPRTGLHIEPQYYGYLIRQLAVTGYITSLAKGIRERSTEFRYSEFSPLELALPTIHEQRTIASFLDYETARIDQLIAKQQQLIELLKEKRQAVISHAVTKGLNPNAPMKDSGVEWLGQVPEHWVVKRLKHISPKIGVGLVINPSTYVKDDGVYFLFGGDIEEYGFKLEKTRKMSDEDSRSLPQSRLNEGDLVCVRVGYPGITAVIPKLLCGSNCASMMVVRRGLYDSHWLAYCMNSDIGRKQVELVQYGAAQKQYNIADAIEFYFAVPPLAEQKQISEYLYDKRKKFNSLITNAENIIALLQERRTALISAAVTGKIDLRGWQPPKREVAA